jgi:hypothetical protein
MHEWLHKLGFSHATTYSESRNHSVPYAIGTIMRQIAGSLGDLSSPVDYLLPASGLVLKHDSSKIYLNWQVGASSQGINTYKIYRRLNGSETNYLQASLMATSFSQLRPQTPAIYYIRLVDKAGRTVKSSEVSYIPLTAPQNLTINSTSTQVNLSWTPAKSTAGVTEYRIYRRLSGSTINYYQTKTTALSVLLTKPTKNATYYVRSVDSTGETKKSIEINLNI